MENKATILVVDDELGVRRSFNLVLKDGYNVFLAGTAAEALGILSKTSVDLVLLDIMLPDMNGIDLLEQLMILDPLAAAIMVTAVNDIKTAIKAIKLGAFEYIIKPFDVDDLLTIIARSIEKKRMLNEIKYLKTELNRCYPFEMMVGKNKEMKKIFELISTVAQSEGTVLIQGESGTGKELVARALHNRSNRNQQPFVVINCAAIPASLIESEIFGHNMGAFTGATSVNIGKLEIANTGTVFFDDIDTLDINTQAKLLRFIQEREFQRLGSNKVIKADIRILASSNKDLNTLIEQAEFREDLYYRLNVFPVNLPPLRERKDDIPLLINHFLNYNAKKSGKSFKIFSDSALKVLLKHDWPGNVRELQNMVERMFTLTKSEVIRLKDITACNIQVTTIPNINEKMTLKEAVHEFERKFIADILRRVGGNKKKASERLGIHRNTLLAKSHELGLM